MIYSIGGHNICIELFSGDDILRRVLTSFEPFKSQEKDNVILSIDIVEELYDMDESSCRLTKEVDTGNGIIRVSKFVDGKYKFQIFDVDGRDCATAVCSQTFDKCVCKIDAPGSMVRFALNNVIMLAYAFCSAQYGTLLIHASVVRHNNVAYAFTAKSGTGKSTQVANWMKAVEGCDIINDDNPVVRMIDGKVMLYGSPWSGKTPCFRAVCVPLAALMLIKRDERNFVEEQKPLIAFSTLLTACSAMKWDETLFQQICETVTRIVESIKIAELHCLPDMESALVCKEYLEG